MSVLFFSGFISVWLIMSSTAILELILAQLYVFSCLWLSLKWKVRLKPPRKLYKDSWMQVFQGCGLKKYLSPVHAIRYLLESARKYILLLLEYFILLPCENRTKHVKNFWLCYRIIHHLCRNGSMPFLNFFYSSSLFLITYL